MAPKAIVSYDDTPNDRDGLALARVLGQAGTELALAYVRHASASEPERELLEDDEVRALLARGARALGDLDVRQHVVVNASTPEGLKGLAEREDADIIVFGSDYRTAAGHVAPQKSAERLLEGAPVAIAIAPANYRSDHITTFGRIGLIAAPGDETTVETASDLAEMFGARLTHNEPFVDLLVVGSRPEAPEGRVLLSSFAQREIERANSPVLVVPHRVSVRFRVPVGV